MKTIFTIVMFFLPVFAMAQDPPMPPPMPPLLPPDSNFFFYRNAPMGPMVRMRVHMPPGNWWKNSEIAQQLGITDQQRQQLEQAFVEHRMKLADLNAAVEKQEIKLQALMDTDQPPEGQVMAQLDQLLAARGNLEKEFTAMTLNFRRIVTPEQWRKLQSIQEKDRRVVIMRGEGMESGTMTSRPPR